MNEMNRLPMDHTFGNWSGSRPTSRRLVPLRYLPIGQGRMHANAHKQIVVNLVNVFMIYHITFCC